MNLGIFATAKIYNVYCFPCLSYVMQFFPPTPEVLKIEYGLLQDVISGPNNSITFMGLIHLRDFGLPIEFCSLKACGVAAMIRTAAMTCKCTQQLKRAYMTFLEREDVRITLSMGVRYNWFQGNAILVNWEDCSRGIFFDRRHLEKNDIDGILKMKSETQSTQFF